MDSFETLIVPIEKSVRLPENDREMFASATEVRPNRPTFSISPWQRYQLRMARTAEIDVFLKFRDRVSRSEYRLRLVSEVRLSHDMAKQKSLVRWTHGQGGLKTKVIDKLGDALTQWVTINKPGQRLLGAVLESIDSRDQGMAEVDRVALAAVQSFGFDTNFIRITPVAWDAQRSVEVNEHSLWVRLSDHDAPLNISLIGELFPKKRSEAYYTSALSLTGTTDSVQARVIDAIRRELGGSRLQEWKTGEKSLRERAIVAGNREAAKYGWALAPEMLLRSDVEVVLLSENFKLEEHYRLPGVGRMLTIEHHGTFRLEDAARFEQRKKAQPECADFKLFILKQAKAVTERKLQRSSYGQAIELLGNSKQLEEEIRGDLSEIVRQYGYSCTSCHVIVKNLPEQALLQESGYNGQVFPLDWFSLSIQNKRVELGLSGRLKLVEPQKLEPLFSDPRKWQSNDGAVELSSIINVVAERAKVRIRAFLNQIDVAEYRLSDLSAGPALEADREVTHVDPIENIERKIPFRALQKKLAQAIAEDIREEFGIEFTDIAFIRGDEPVSVREQELKDYKGEVAVTVEVPSETDFSNKTVDVWCPYSIKKQSEAYVSEFASEAMLPTKDDQIARLDKTLSDTLENIIKQSRYELLRGRHLALVGEVTSRILRGVAQRHHGLEIVIDPSAVRTDVPPSEGTEELAGLNGQIEQLKQKRIKAVAQLSGDEEDDELHDRIAAMTNNIRRIETMRDEIKANKQSAPVDPDAMLALPKFAESLRLTVSTMMLPQPVYEAVTYRLDKMLGHDSADGDGAVAESDDHMAEDADFEDIPASDAQPKTQDEFRGEG